MTHKSVQKIANSKKTLKKRVITVPITVYEGIRGDPRASQNFRLFKIFLSHEKKTFSIGDEKLPYLGENQMKSTNLFFLQ